jgi:hypothetical protein
VFPPVSSSDLESNLEPEDGGVELVGARGFSPKGWGISCKENLTKSLIESTRRLDWVIG